MRHLIQTRFTRVIFGGLLSILLLGLFTAPAWAQGGGTPEVAGADLEGCEGEARSAGEDGERLGVVAAPGSLGASQDDPLLVEWEGPVKYSGTSEPQIIKNHEWQVRVYGIPVRSDGDENADDEVTTKGTEVMSDFLPFKMVGLYYVDGEIEGDEGAGCSGAIWLKLQGNPIGTIPWLLGAALTVGGVALMASTVRPSLVPASDEAQPTTADATAAPVAVKKKRHPISGLFVGLFMGLGVSLVMISHSFAPFGRWTVIAVAAALAIAGAAMGTAGPPRDKTKKMRRAKKGPKGPKGSDASAAADAQSAAQSTPEQTTDRRNF